MGYVLKIKNHSTFERFIKKVKYKIKNTIKIKSNNEGLFVVYEGIDACGKSIQISNVKEKLEKQGYTVYVLHFPQENTPAANLIYNLLNTHNPIIHQRPDLFQPIYVVDQYITQKFIHNKLKEYDFVLCDRYMYSTIAFGMANGLEFKQIRKWQSELRHADLVLYLDIPVKEVHKRIRIRDSHEDNLSFLRNVRKHYKDMHLNFKNNNEFYRGVVINGVGDINEITEQCYSHIICLYKLY